MTAHHIKKFKNEIALINDEVYLKGLADGFSKAITNERDRAIAEIMRLAREAVLERLKEIGSKYG